MDRSCLVFDFDGTILDTEEPVFRSWSELWSQHGIELGRAEWQATIGTADNKDPWMDLERRLGHPIDPAHAQRRRERRDQLQAEVTPRDGVLNWLVQAGELHIPIGIASSSSHQWVDGHLVRLNLRHHFSTLVCCDDHVPSKPDPTSYRLACHKLRAQPTRSVAVEDSPHGVEAAKAAGLFTVAVPHPLTAGLDLSRADIVVDSLDSIQFSDIVALASRVPVGPDRRP